jgi:pimeloyl-ACP methyl ester carboxylesterase
MRLNSLMPVAGLSTIALVATMLSGVAIAPAASAFEPTLNFYECPEDAQPAGVECASLTVPLDWQTPEDGRTTEIALRVVRAPKNNRGGFTFNPGGPGGSGIDVGALVHSELPASVQSRFDFVMWDPRGVGLSGPTLTNCPDFPQPQGLNVTGPVDWETVWADHGRAIGQANAECFAANPDAAPYLGTWQVVRDLEAMRIALGYPRWNYWGMSYGTRIAYTYAKTFPRSLRTMIVDGSLPPQETVFRNARQQPAAYNAGQQVYASIVGKAQSRKIDQILAALDEEVLVDSEGAELTRWEFFQFVYNAFRNQSSYSTLKPTVNAIYDAIFAPTTTRQRKKAISDFLKLAEEQEVVNPTYTFAFITCADLHDRPSPELMGQVAAATARAYSTPMPMATINGLLCNGLAPDYSPGVPRNVESISLATPPMVVLSIGDIATPWIWGRAMANQYARSVTVNYTSTQHVSYLFAGSACIDRPVTRYLITRERPRTDLDCPFAP